VTRERNERKEMEKVFMTQASKVEEVFQQNRDLSQCLVDLEKLWVEEEKFTRDLASVPGRGCSDGFMVHPHGCGWV